MFLQEEIALRLAVVRSDFFAGVVHERCIRTGGYGTTDWQAATEM